MTKISPLENILIRGFYGAYEGIKEDKLTKIKEIKDLEIFQITKYKKFTSTLKDLSIDGLTLPEEKMKSNCNKNSRILWCGPNHWLLVTNKKDLMKNVNMLMDNGETEYTKLEPNNLINLINHRVPPGW